MEDELIQNWPTGVDNLNQILQFSSQFIAAITAINNVLEQSSTKELLRHIAYLANQPFDSKLLRFCSASLKSAMLNTSIDLFIWIPSKWIRSWQVRHPAELRLDTPARCASAGFWLWYEDKAHKSALAFENIRDLPHGKEIYNIALAIDTGEYLNDLAGISEWKQSLSWLDSLPDPELRSGTLQVLRTLREVSKEASTAHYAQSPLNRSGALNRANAKLNNLIETGAEYCPNPEWPLLKKIAEQWQEIIIKAGGIVGEEILREPVINPYDGYSGLPVTGHTFVGRRNAMQQIEARWASSNSLQAIILYGHRRMGKTSILRNLEHYAPTNTLLIYLDTQDAGFIDHTGEFLLDLAEAIHTRATAAQLDVGDAPAEDDYARLGRARRSLNALLDKLDTQMNERHLIIAIDEFELIEKGIEDGRIDADLLAYLRSINQEYPWLGLIFGGLHTLDEMGRDYQSAFYGQTEHIRVGYLSRDETIRLVTQPHPDFALEYSPELLEEIYRLTYGQPYLLQRLCWELVNQWNERFLKQGETTPRTLQLNDLEPVLDADFYKSAEYYFTGVWSNVTDAEQALMKLIAQNQEPRLLDDLAKAAEHINLTETIKLLKRHDVIVQKENAIHFASELMRRWINRRHQS